jgi:plastocyanin
MPRYTAGESSLASPSSATLGGLAVALSLLAAPMSRGAPVPRGSIVGEVVVVRASLRPAPPLEQVVVYLEDAPALDEMSKGPFEMAQADRSFAPPLLIVPVGATVAFPNRDGYYHNVFSPTADAKFDLGLYRGGIAKTATLEKPGVVSVYCNIHPQMSANVLVVANPYYARVGGNGRFEIQRVPRGTWHAVIWSPFAAPARETVQVEAGKDTQLRVTIRQRSGDERHLNKEGKEYQPYSQVSPDR